MKKSDARLAKGLVLFVSIYLLSAWTLVWFNDFRGHDWIFDAIWPAHLRDQTIPYLWIAFFREGSPTEILQWMALALGAFICLACLIRARGSEPSARVGLALLFLGLLVMYFEDAHNLRHELSAWVGSHWLDQDVTSLEWRRSTGRSLIELSVYALLGGLMLAAALLLWQWRAFPNKARHYLLAGYGFYGLAAIGSATRNLGDWYARLGGWMVDALGSIGGSDIRGDELSFHRDPNGFWFMDLLVEESLELLGASLLLGSCLLCYARLRREDAD